MALDCYFRDDDFWAELGITMSAEPGTINPQVSGSYFKVNSR
jgi:hypothetical protein